MYMGCVEGDAQVIVNRGGNAKRFTLRHLHDKFHGPWKPSIPTRIASLSGGELHLNSVINVIRQGVRPVVRLALSSGRHLRLTPDHEVATPGNRWAAASSLKPGDQVLVNGTPACAACRSTERVISYRYAKYQGLCRPCAARASWQSRLKAGIVDKDGYVRLYRILRHHGKHGGYLHLDSAPSACFIPKVDTVVSVEPAGETDVYDLQMTAPAHNFVVNGIVVHNCGKSRVAVELAARRQLFPILILCPLRVVEVWREQFALHLPGQYEFLALDARAGSVEDKTRAARERLAWATEKRRPLAIAINYQSAWLNPFARWALGNVWPLVIADELHRCKAPTGAASRFVGKLALCARYRLGLTGTPMPHSPLDVWAQFRFLNRTIYDPTYSSFKHRYAETGGYMGKETIGYQELDELRRKFFQITFQVGQEVLDLPEVRDQTQYCTLGATGARIYSEMERDLVAWIESTPAPIVAANALVRLLRLQQITSGTVVDTRGEEHDIDQAKQDLLEDLLEDLAADEPVVIFAVFTSDLARIRAVAAKLGRRSGELSGKHDDLAAWKRGRPDDPVILAVQMQAGGEGIDLTRAAYGVYYSLGFNLGLYLQSRSRLWRPGQKRGVSFYHLAAHLTVDTKVLRALDRRQNLVEGVLQELKCPHPLPTN
jgi:superfamily II DNA or RNA helicase